MSDFASLTAELTEKDGIMSIEFSLECRNIDGLDSFAKLDVKSHGARTAHERMFLTETLTQLLAVIAKRTMPHYCVISVENLSPIVGFRACLRKAICAYERDLRGPPVTFFMSVREEDLIPQEIEEEDAGFCRLTLLV